MLRITKSRNTGLATNGGHLFPSTMTEVLALAGTEVMADVVEMVETLGRPVVAFVVPRMVGRVLAATGATEAMQDAAGMVGRLAAVGTARSTNTRSEKSLTSTI